MTMLTLDVKQHSQDSEIPSNNQVQRLVQGLLLSSLCHSQHNTNFCRSYYDLSSQDLNSVCLCPEMDKGVLQDLRHLLHSL